MFLEIAEDTDGEDIRRAIPDLMEWRRRLSRKQGPWTAGGKGGLMMRLDIDNRDNGVSYRQLARRINQAVAQALKKNDRYGAMSWLIDCGISEGEAGTWCDYGLENLAAGRDAFDDDQQPITSDHMRYSLRYWREKWQWGKSGRDFPLEKDTSG
jgi:hypothetical protein